MVKILIFLFGLAIGSFLNCVIYRTELQEDMQEGSSRKKSPGFLQGRSFCPLCRHTLSWQDLIPVLSFLILKGRCRYCQNPISRQYPLVELATAIVFLLIFWNLQFGIYLEFGIWNLLFYLTISSLLIIIFVYDLKHYIIPDKIVFPAIAIALLFRILNLKFISNLEFRISNLEILINPLASAFLASAFFLAIVLVSQGKWMGIGDIKLAFLMGLILGWPSILVALFSAFLIGAIIGVVLMILGKKTFKSEVPFGPFLVTGTFLALFWGREIINFYVQKFSLSAF